jgi:hypothetical protein
MPPYQLICDRLHGFFVELQAFYPLFLVSSMLPGRVAVQGVHGTASDGIFSGSNASYEQMS